MHFIWKGVSSAAHGIVVRSLPPLGVPQKRDQSFKVAGRSGNLHVQDGAWEETLKPVGIYLPYAQGAQVSPIARVAAYLSGTGRVSFSNLPGRYFEARLVNALLLGAWVDDFDDLTATVAFQCQPFAYHEGAGDIVMSAPGIIDNPGTASAQPKLVVSATGDFQLSVGRSTLAIEGADYDKDVVIDSYLMDAYQGAALINDRMTGEFPTLAPGANAVVWTGGVVSVRIEPNWRDLG